MKTCIWCKRTEKETAFLKEAHIVPQNLGGKRICQNVCDDCNHYFGAKTKDLPAIETVLKETFNISRARFLNSQGEVGKNKAMPKFSSTYFNCDLKNNRLSLKPRYKLHKAFQENVGFQMKRGLYKMFLEENEVTFGDSLDARYDFIREYSRYGIGDYPVYYFERHFGIIPMSTDWAKHPELILDEELKMNYLIQHPSYVEFEFLGHVFSLATTRAFDLSFNNYAKETWPPKQKFFKNFKIVDSFNDVDLLLRIIG